MKKHVKVIDLGTMEYGKCLELQRKLRDLRIADEIGDTLLLVEHTPVLTMGRRGQNDNVVVSEEFLKENGIREYAAIFMDMNMPEEDGLVAT